MHRYVVQYVRKYWYAAQLFIFYACGTQRLASFDAFFFSIFIRIVEFQRDKKRKGGAIKSEQ